MSAELARAHITAQERLRALAARGVSATWAALPAYDEENIDEWLSGVLPLVGASQRQSVALTEAYLARSAGRQPLGVSPGRVIAGLRAGVPPEAVYRRPFVTVWSALGAGRGFEAAVSAGLSRATGTVATDVQLAMRETLSEVGQEDRLIVGYQRVPDGGACAFCRLVAGQRYRTDQLMPLHPRCGCGVDVITGQNRGDFTGMPENDLSVEGAAVHEHGELGPVLTDPAHDFTAESDLG